MLASTACMSQAQTRVASTSDFHVRIEIVATCEVSTPNDINFGATVHRVGATDVKNTQLAVQCTNRHPYVVNIGKGQNFGNDLRNMVHNDGTKIAYVLAQEGSMSTQWLPETDIPGTGIGLGDTTFNIVHDIYAQAHLVGTESVGEHTDLVRATVTY